jgi:hypothetical protein
MKLLGNRPLILVLRRLRQEDHEFKATLGCTARHCLKKKKKKKKKLLGKNRCR